MERQGEEIVALREENRSLRDRICTAHVISENPISTALYNVNSSVNADAETASIQSTSNGKVTKSPRSANPGGELVSEIESSDNCVVNMTDESPKQTVIEGPVSYMECATYNEMVKRNQVQAEGSQLDQTLQQKEVSSKSVRKTTELRQDKSTAEKGENADGSTYYLDLNITSVEILEQTMEDILLKLSEAASAVVPSQKPKPYLKSY